MKRAARGGRARRRRGRNASGAMRSAGSRRPRHRRHVQGSDDRQGVERHALRIRSRQDQDQGQGPRGAKKLLPLTAIRSSPSGPASTAAISRRSTATTSPSSTSRGSDRDGHRDRHPRRRQGLRLRHSSSSRSAFDALTGALDRSTSRPRRPDAQGGMGQRTGQLPRSRIHGFPNLFMITGPGSPSVLGNTMAPSSITRPGSPSASTT